MKKTTTTLITAAASVALVAPAVHAAPAVPPAASYSDLFEPIPNATERLKASDAESEARFIEAQYNPPPANAHHHHHHHHHNRHWYRSHGYVWMNGQWVMRPAHHHHHQQHHHHQMPQ